ncbi:MAG TPA: FAD-linked oxidase C-terminal domain-containing protein [Polyangiaceae bacterium]|jgi:glycolate oxidase|nr:FAD-linked oxidase C-terminal domain-containing protein [Polyangiaceae bacterium]
MTSAVDPPAGSLPSRASAERAQRLLERALGPSKVLTDPEACAPYASDESEAEGRVPDAVVLATSPEDILAALSVARETGVPVTPRGAGTGRTGGATPTEGGIVLSSIGMNRIVHIDRRERVAVVEPGVVLAELHAAVEAEGLFYPPDPNSLASCAIGGNLAENAGGPRAFKYGVTGHYVLGVEAFLMGGQRIFAGKRTVKGVTGYDVTSLLVGSEGTLAVLGAATLRLVPLPESATTLLGLFDGSANAMRAVGEIVAAGLTPRCIEFLDDSTLGALRAAGNAIPATARALLIVEVDGDERACEAQTERIAGALADVSAIDLVVARDGAQRESLWSARREMSRAVRRMAKKKLSEDVVVPRQRLGELLECTAVQSERSGVRALSYGHAGDGNLHVNFLWNEDEERPNVELSIEQLFRDVVRLGGTLSGEHGIGVTKAPYLPIEQSSELIMLQRDIKRTFDPEGLLNPGKIFATASHRAC